MIAELHSKWRNNTWSFISTDSGHIRGKFEICIGFEVKWTWKSVWPGIENQAYMLQVFLKKYCGHSKKGQTPEGHPTRIFCRKISMSSNQRIYQEAHLNIRQHCVLPEG